jgi:hypothetical protein
LSKHNLLSAGLANAGTLGAVLTGAGVTGSSPPPLPQAANSKLMIDRYIKFFIFIFL